MTEEIRDKFEVVATELGELSEVIRVMRLGLMNGDLEMEYVLGCILYAESGLNVYQDRILQLLDNV